MLLREGQGRIPQFLMRTAPRGAGPRGAMRRVYESGNCILMKDKEMKRTVLEDPKADIIFRGGLFNITLTKYNPEKSYNHIQRL